jgi:hypothetical protein
MTITAELETLQDYAETASDDFRRQLEVMRSAISKDDGSSQQGFGAQDSAKGIDRSREFTPIARPSILRSQAFNRGF